MVQNMDQSAVTLLGLVTRRIRNIHLLSLEMLQNIFAHVHVVFRYVVNHSVISALIAE